MTPKASAQASAVASRLWSMLLERHPEVLRKLSETAMTDVTEITAYTLDRYYVDGVMSLVDKKNPRA